MSPTLTPLPNDQFRIIPATELKNRLGTVIKSTIKKQSEVIISSRGVPQVALIPYTQWQKFFDWQKEQNEKTERKEAWEKFLKLRKEVRANNPNLTEKQAQKFANRFSSDVMKAVIKKRQKKYG